LDKTRKKHKLTRYGFSKNIFHMKSMLNVCCWKLSNVFYWFCAELRGFLENCVCISIGEGMYVNPVVFKPTSWRVEGDFVVVGTRNFFGRVWQTPFKTITCRKVSIQLPYGTKGVSHGKTCTWFEGAHNFVTRSNCDGKQPAPLNDDIILL
jgi:hypothetical protein